MARARELTIEEFATLSASLAAPFSDRAKILEHGGLDEAGWAETKAAMEQFMAARLRVDDRTALESYRAAYATAQASSAASPAPGHQTGVLVAAAAPAPGAVGDAAMQAEAPKFTPSYMLGVPLGAQAARAVAPPPERIVIRPPEQRPPEQPPPVVDPDETQMVDPRSLKPSLPFDTSKRAQQIVISSAPQTPSPSAGFTIAGSSGARPSMPFARLAAPNPASIPPGWTIARYAALCFDLHASGFPEEKVLAMAQITRDQRLALDAYWQNRMNAEPALRVEWKGHADRREAELRASRGGR